MEQKRKGNVSWLGEVTPVQEKANLRDKHRKAWCTAGHRILFVHPEDVLPPGCKKEGIMAVVWKFMGC